MKKLIIFLLLGFSTLSWTRTANVLPVSLYGEAWIKYNCQGVVTPRYAWPVIEKPIMVAHVKINIRNKYPSFEDIRDANSDLMKNFTKVCTEKRWAKVEFGDWTGSWLDWGTDWGYTRYDVSEVFIPSNQLNQCRAIGSPCESNGQCCGGNSYQARCNTQFKTCESNIIEHETNTTKSNL